MKNKVVITGAKGQLGTDLVKMLRDKGSYEVYSFGRQELDITDTDNVNKIIMQIQPEIVVHAAAFTNVDLAESEPDKAYLVNAIGTRNVAVASERVGAKLVYVSTDYVFNGESDKPYNEFDPTSPLGVYGKSKLAGEEFVKDFHSQFFVVRTSWVFGRHGNNFVKTMLKLADEKEQLAVVDDQTGCPTFTVDLAACIRELIATDKYGTYHVSNSGSCTWYEFAREIFRQADKDIHVDPVTTEEFPRPAPRPHNSVFDHLALRLNGFPETRSWQTALSDFLS